MQGALSSHELSFGLQPAFIAQRKLVDLFGQMKLKLLAALHQCGAELQKMLLDQTGRCSEGHAAGQVRTVEILAQGLVRRFGLAGGERC